MLRCCARFPSCWLGRGESSIIDPVHRGPTSRSALMARKASRRRPGRGAEHCPMSVSSLDYRFEANVFVTADLEQAPRRLDVEGGRGDQVENGPEDGAGVRGVAVGSVSYASALPIRTGHVVFQEEVGHDLSTEIPHHFSVPTSVALDMPLHGDPRGGRAHRRGRRLAGVRNRHGATIEHEPRKTCSSKSNKDARSLVDPCGRRRRPSPSQTGPSSPAPGRPVTPAPRRSTPLPAPDSHPAPPPPP